MREVEQPFCHACPSAVRIILDLNFLAVIHKVVIVLNLLTVLLKPVRNRLVLGLSWVLLESRQKKEITLQYLRKDFGNPSISASF